MNFHDQKNPNLGKGGKKSKEQSPQLRVLG